MKSRSIVLILAGIFQLWALAMRIGIFFSLASRPRPENVAMNFFVESRQGIALFNAMVTVTLVFFAAVSLFKRRTLVNSHLGRIVCWFAAAFYASAAIVMALQRGLSAVAFPGFLLLVALAYTYAALPLPKGMAPRG